jgi:histidinol-phosphatase (PHP family)
MFDYHLHTKLCGHAEGEMEEYVEFALKLGLKEIGFSDHSPLLHLKDPSLSMSEEQFPEYIEEVERLQKRYSGIKIKLGLEVDFVPEKVEALARLISSYEFDYVYGSIHFLGNWLVDHPAYQAEFKNRNIFQVYEEYFSLVQSAAKSGLFDLIAHLDVVKKFNYRPAEDITEILEKTTEVLKGSGVGIEVNTAGLRKPCQEIYPALNLLKMCARKEIPVVLGSDAHRKEEVGFAFDQARDLLRAAGYKKLAQFEKRKWHLVPF